MGKWKFVFSGVPLVAGGCGDRMAVQPPPTTGNRPKIMKTAYELAMERLKKTAPVMKLTAPQKKEIAELESKCKAKIAERELFV